MSDGKKKNGFFQNMQMKLAKFAAMMGSNIYVVGIRDAMLAYMPFTFIASIFLILANFPAQGFNDFVSSVLHCEAAVWQGKLMYIYQGSIAIGGLLVVLTTSYSMADKMKLNRIQVVITALVAYLTLTPLSSLEDGANALALDSVSAQSMFCAILIGIFTSVIYRAIDSKGIKIKMPSSVPPAVSAPFESLLPSLGVLLVFWVIRLILDAFGTNAVALINGTLGIPLTLVGGSIGGIAFVMLFQQLLWFFGLHGSSIVSGVMQPILQVLEDQNKAASLAGGVPENIICNSFFTHFASIGLQGAIIAALIVAVSRQYKSIARMAVVPYVFGVGEPALFGFPLMLNFKLFIPTVITPAVSALVAYIGFATGFVPAASGLVQLPWTTPLIVSGVLVTNSWRGGVMQLILLVVSTLIWIPFIRSADRDNLKIEQQSETAK